MGAIQDSIEKFVRYFFDQIDQIDAITGPNPQAQRLFQKTLFAILLDTLSIAAKPGLVKQNKERFTSFIDSCSSWQDRNRVSSWQLMLDLEQRKLTNGTVYRYVSSRVQAWDCGGRVGLEADPTINEISALNGSKMEMIAATNSSYDLLLYSYRNSLIHELRSPGYGFDFPEEDGPFYQCMTHLSGQENRGFSWQFSFPISFIRRLCLSSIWGLHGLLTEQERDPYEAYPFGSLWKPRQTNR